MKTECIQVFNVEVHNFCQLVFTLSFKSTFQINLQRISRFHLKLGIAFIQRQQIPKTLNKDIKLYHCSSLSKVKNKKLFVSEILQRF